MFRSVLGLWGAACVLVLCIVLGGCHLDALNGPQEFHDTTRIRDFDYDQGRIYDLFYQDEPVRYTYRVLEIKAFEACPPTRPEDELVLRWARLKIDPDTSSSLFTEIHQLREIDRNRISFVSSPQTGKHYIIFKQSRQEFGLGVWMRVERHSGGIIDTVTVGDLAADTITLKMLHPVYSYLPVHPTWPLMWRNVYRMPQFCTPAELDIRVLEAPPGSEGTSFALEDQRLGGTTSQGKYIWILGLDQYDMWGNKRRDDIVDDRPEVFRSDLGLLIFPARRPFDSDTQYVDALGIRLPQLAETVPELYRYTSAKEMTDNSKYYIEYHTTLRYEPNVH